MEKGSIENNIKPKKRLSIKRLMIAVLILFGFFYWINISLEELNGTEYQSDYKSWFAAYVDVTSVPLYAFEKPVSDASMDVVLAFIVSSEDDPCIPTWGNYYTMDEAATTLNLDRRIARLQQQEGRIAISFGGALNSELAVNCTDEEKLFNAYKSVINRYNINTIDLDLEGDGLVNADASKRRAKVIARLQKDYKENNKNIAVWLTMPVIPNGLTQDGTAVISDMLSSGVDLAGVNVMTMDYGESKEDNQSMIDASKQALINTHRQLNILYMQSEISLSDEALWQKIGATPMIGQNDIVDEIFTIEDAEILNIFAHENGIGRMSMWSANRDVPCGENYVDTKVVSDLCSGVTSDKSSFMIALSKNFDGDLLQNASMVTIDDPEANIHIVDNPDTSPYQIWKETGVYLKGTKVVWHGNVYEAKWWTKNDLPDNPVLQTWETPWQLIGPVLPNEKPVEPLMLPSGTYPEWSGDVVYDIEDRVLYRGMAFQAKWWNQGESPAAAASNPDSSPWFQLTDKQILEILRSQD